MPLPAERREPGCNGVNVRRGAAVSRALDSLRARGREVRRSGGGWKAQCPARPEHREALTIRLHGVNVPVGDVLLGGAMKRLVEFPLDHGGSVVVEVDEPLDGPVIRGLGKERSTLVEKADKTFEDATAAVIPAARSLIARLRSVEDAPD